MHSRFRRYIRWLLLACLASLASQPALARLPTPDRATVVFVDVNVLPMEQPGVLHKHAVLVEDGRIAAVAPDLAIPAGAQVIDGKGSAWLLPGLADMHNHAHSPQDQELQLALGITTTLHMGEAPNSFAGRMRHAAASGDSAGPRILAALAVDGSPRYGHLVVDSAEDARAAVQLASRNGYDFIKVYNNLSAPAFAALAQEVQRQGIGLIGHGVQAVGLRRQLEAGQSLAAHAEEFFYAFFPGAEGEDPNAPPGEDQIRRAVELLRRHDATVVADLVTYEAIARQWGRPEVVEAFLRTPESRYLPPEMRVSWPRQGYSRREGSLDARLQFLRRFVRAMHEADIPLLSGTDAPSIPGLVSGFALHRNLAALVEAGLSPHAALETATRTPGRFLRQHRPGLPVSGVVTEGARADLLLVAADPLADLGTLAAPLGVMADGRWYPQADLEARKAAIRRAYAEAAATAREVENARVD